MITYLYERKYIPTLGNKKELAVIDDVWISRLFYIGKVGSI